MGWGGAVGKGGGGVTHPCGEAGVDGAVEAEGKILALIAMGGAEVETGGSAGHGPEGPCNGARPQAAGPCPLTRRGGVDQCGCRRRCAASCVHYLGRVVARAREVHAGNAACRRFHYLHVRDKPRDHRGGYRDAEEET